MKTASNNTTVDPLSGFLSSVGDVAGDIIEAGELQVRLARLDAKAVGKSSMVPLTTVLSGLSILIASLPMLGFGIASWLAEWMAWPAWQSQIVVGAVMAVVAVMVMVLGLRGLKQSINHFNRSVSELSKNVAWIKSLVRSSVHESHAKRLES